MFGCRPLLHRCGSRAPRSGTPMEKPEVQVIYWWVVHIEMLVYRRVTATRNWVAAFRTQLSSICQLDDSVVDLSRLTFLGCSGISWLNPQKIFWNRNLRYGFMFRAFWKHPQELFKAAAFVIGSPVRGKCVAGKGVISQKRHWYPFVTTTRVTLHHICYVYIYNVYIYIYIDLAS